MTARQIRAEHTAADEAITIAFHAQAAVHLVTGPDDDEPEATQVYAKLTVEQLADLVRVLVPICREHGGI